MKFLLFPTLILLCSCQTNTLSSKNTPVDKNIENKSETRLIGIKTSRKRKTNIIPLLVLTPLISKFSRSDTANIKVNAMSRK